MRLLLSSCVVLASVVLFADPVVARAPPSQRDFWQSRVAKVRVGMTRKEVEQLLPPFSPSEAEPWNNTYAGSSRFMTGGCQSNLYYVAPGWHLSVCYDYTGIPRDAKGMAIKGGENHPDNLLLALPVLEWKLLKREPTYVLPD